MSHGWIAISFAFTAWTVAAWRISYLIDRIIGEG
jgi:hypothetical protein